MYESLFTNGCRDAFFLTKHLARQMIIDSPPLASGSPFRPQLSVCQGLHSKTVPILYMVEMHGEATVENIGLLHTIMIHRAPSL